MTKACATTIVVIPARGGSKGVPRKNLRPLNGRPLIYYTIAAALGADGVNAVIVDTDDQEIALFARRFGARIQMRPDELAGDTVALDPVIRNTVRIFEEETGAKVDNVVTVQPTSPLVRSEDIEKALRLLETPDTDTVISAVSDRHLTWRKTDDGFLPNYTERVNRQFLPEVYRETGAVVACRAETLRATGSRIGRHIQLLIVPHDRSIDIDTYQDFAVAEFLLKRRRVAFVVVGNRDLGLGHAYRTLMLAHELVDQDLHFYCLHDSEMAAELIARSNYSVEVITTEALLRHFGSETPDLVINDILDTDADYVVALKKLGCTVVNFEDLGLGAEVADRVYNALYPHQLPLPHIRVGARYFCLRDEFIHGLEKQSAAGAARPVQQVLVTFGGVDEANLTVKVVESVAAICQARGIRLDIVAGPGYAHMQQLDAVVARLRTQGLEVAVTCAPAAMSEHMAAAQIAFSSAGRTVFELASLRVPTVVLCQNARETTHTFANAANGFFNLGLGVSATSADILKSFERLVDDAALRSSMTERMAANDFRAGKETVVSEIKDLLAGARRERERP